MNPNQWRSLVLRVRNKAVDELGAVLESKTAVVTTHVLMTSDGRPLLWTEPFISLSDPIAGDHGQWPDFIDDTSKSVASAMRNTKDGVCAATLRVAINCDGHPIFWNSLRVIRIEPSKNAKEKLLAILTETS